MVFTDVQVVLERCEKFLSPLYWTDINIRSQMYSGIQPVHDLACVRFGPTAPHFRFSHVRELWDKTANPCAVGDSFGPSWSTIWFRFKVSLLEDSEGQVSALRWDSSSEAMLYSSDGKPLQAFTGGSGSDRRELYIITTEDSIAGTQIEFYVEMACNGMFGNGNNGMIRPPDPDRSFTLATAELVCINVPVHGLFWDLECLHGLGISSKDAATVANVVTAISRILNAVDLRDAESLRQCRAVAQTILDAPDAVKIDHDVTAVGHCHIDTAWLWSYKETRRKVARSWCTQLSLMDAYPDWRFVASQAVQWEWLEDGCPDLFERVKARVDDGRFIPIGGTYVEFDANIPSLESFIRQFLYGSQYFRDKLGLATDVFWLPDTFGYSAQLPQVMRGFNIKYFLSQKLSWNLFNKFPHSTFTWEGIDGSSVLAHFPPSDTYNASCSAQDFLKCSENHKSLISCNQSMLLFGHGDGGGGPHPSHLAHLERYKTSKGLPRIHTDRTPSDFFKGVEQDFKLRDKALSTPTWQGELYLELHQGTLTSQATIKKQNRQCEHLMRVVEALFVKVILSGRLEQSLILETQQAVDKLWKDILLNQFHDVIPGSSIHQVYEDSNGMLARVLAQGHKMCTEFVSKLVPVSDADCTCYSNMLSYSRDIELQDGRRLHIEPFAIALSTSATTQSISKTVVLEVSNGSYILENEFLKATVSSYGALLSLTDKRFESGREVIVQGLAGNNLVIYDDVPFYWDAWDVFEYHKYRGVSINHDGAQQGLTSSRSLRIHCDASLLENEVVFKLTEWGSPESCFQQTIRLASSSAVLEFETAVHWHERHKLLKVEFPLRVRASTASYDIQGGYVNRPTHRNTPFDAAMFEVCGHQFADLSEGDYGVALLNDCKYGYSCCGSTLCLSLLRAPKSPDPDCDMGVHTFKYGLYLHQGGTIHSGDVHRVASCFNAPVLKCEVPIHQSCDDARLRSPMSNHTASTSLVKICSQNCGLVIETVKLALNGQHIIIRFVEKSGTRGRAMVWFSFDVTLATATNLMEEPVPDASVFFEVVSPFELSLFYEPFKILTIRIPH